MPTWSLAAAVLAAFAFACPAAAQQRPLTTQDPEPVGAGRLLVEGGVDYEHDMQYPVSGLQGNLWRLPILGVSLGISSIAEFQIEGGPYDHLAITNRLPNAAARCHRDRRKHDARCRRCRGRHQDSRGS